MPQYYFYDPATGIIDTSFWYAGDADDLALNTPAGKTAVTGVADSYAQRWDDTQGKLIDYQPPSPGDDALQTWSWNIASSRWISTPTLLAEQNAHWEKIKTIRSLAIAEPVIWDASTFDADPASRAAITAAACAALIADADAASFSVAWTLANNTVRTLSSTEIQAVATAMTASSEAAQTTSQSLRTAIYATTDISQLPGIAWP
jgi:hypothetical protein